MHYFMSEVLVGMREDMNNKIDKDVLLLLIAGVGVGVLSILEAVGYVSIGWVWVFSPLWLPIMILSAVLFGAIIYVGIKIFLIDRD